jgi:short subunit dehydrogenase-like uncharacterized protein
MKQVVVYGAYGHIGRQIVRALLRHECIPLIAGRDRRKVQTMARQMGLRPLAFEISEAESALPDVGVLINAAGPFVATAGPLATAAMSKGIHYLDVSNEPEALRSIYALDPLLTDHDCIAVPGTGFGCAASNCLLEQLLPLSARWSVATILLAPQVRGRGDATIRTMLSGLRGGCCDVRSGTTVRRSGWSSAVTRELPFGRMALVPVPLGDGVAAFRSSGIPRIAACVGLRAPARVAGAIFDLGRGLLSLNLLHDVMARPNESSRSSDAQESSKPSYVWVEAQDANGREYEAWLETGEGNAFTAETTARAALRVLQGAVTRRGALTPAMAFGGGWLGGIPETIIHLPSEAGRGARRVGQAGATTARRGAA